MSHRAGYDDQSGSADCSHEAAGADSNIEVRIVLPYRPIMSSSQIGFYLQECRTTICQA